MYNSHYGFSCSPFENNLDQRFLFFSAGHYEVFSALLYFVKERKSFALVCGDVGTGKTMLINHLLSRLPKSVHPIVISNPMVNYTEILRYIAGELGIANPGRSLLNLIDQVKCTLIEEAQKEKRFVLIIDEAHLLAESSLEAVRLLSNIETEETRLLQILLIGQYELSHKLSKPGMRQLRQRININRFLGPMNAKETIQYVDWRLKVAASTFDSCFEPDCQREIFKRTRGVPRAINRLCDNALLIGKSKGTQKVNRKIVRLADEALQSDILFIPAASPGRRASKVWTGMRSLAMVSSCVILAVLTGTLAYRGLLATRAQQVIQAFVPAQPGLSEIATSKQLASGSHDPDLAVKRYPLTKATGTEPIPSPAPAADADPVPVSAAPAAAITAVVSPANPAVTAGADTAAPATDAEAPPMPLPSPDQALPLPAQEVTATEPEVESRAEPIQPEGPSRFEGIKSIAHAKSGAEPIQPEGPWQAPEPGTHPATADAITEASVPEDFLPEKPSVNSSLPLRVVVRPGDTLASIAVRWYPGRPASGLKTVLAANAAIGDENRIYPGQVLIVPEPDPVEGAVLPEGSSNAYFAVYGQYSSMERLRKEKAWLTRRKIKYVIRNTTDSNGGALYQILVGGFESAQDLERALAVVKIQRGIKGHH
jgi:general secretion pathway protein A